MNNEETKEMVEELSVFSRNVARGMSHGDLYGVIQISLFGERKAQHGSI